MTMALKTLIVAACMLGTAGLAVAMKPTHKLADVEQTIDLGAMIPMRFSDWAANEKEIKPLMAPELQKTIEETYSQTLARTYVDSRGRRIMLSIAYGGTHGEGMQTHRPEVCYPAQGFRVVKEVEPSTMSTKFGELSIKRLVAQQGARHEPITYWVVVGDQQTQFGLKMKLAQLRYTLTGVIPDGMLVRVSSIGSDDDVAYADQARFIQDMLAAMQPVDRARIFGGLPG